MNETKQEQGKANKIETDMKVVAAMGRTFLRNWDSGVLSTQYNIEGADHPYGSITPYALSDEGDIIILISDLAVHTKNIVSNPKVGFTVFDMEANNKQAAARISLVGEAKRVDEDEKRYQLIRDKYLTFFPQASHYFKAHNFFFYAIRPQHIHFIKTFGQIYNFSAQEGHWGRDLPAWKEKEHEAIDHMNEDHRDTLGKYTKELLGMDYQDVSLIAVDQEGFHLKVDNKIRYLNFLGNAHNMNDLRKEFVALARSCS